VDLLRSPSALPVTFLLLCVLHLVHSNSYHLFDYISASFIQTKYHTSIEDSAVLSSITSLFAIVLCPLAGWVLDHTGRKMYVVCGCSVVTTIAFLLMAFTSLTPYAPLVLLSLSISFVPTILRSAVPDCTPRGLLGTAYGAYEVMESIGSVVGHVTVGAIVDVTGGYFGALCVFAGLSATSCLLAAAMSVYDSAVGGTLNEKSDRKDRHRRREEEELRRAVKEETRATTGDTSLGSVVYR
jgi:MFS family permease